MNLDMTNIPQDLYLNYVQSKENSA